MLHGKPFTLRQVPGAGRGLVATRNVPRGATVHAEAPLLCAPAPALRGRVCHHCLKALRTDIGQEPTYGVGGAAFCSGPCAEVAATSYGCIEAAADWSALRAHCAAAGERFPLLVARLACAKLQREGSSGGGSSGGSGAAFGGFAGGDALVDLPALCFAKTNGPPPEPWAAAHGLVVAALAAAGAPADALERAVPLAWFAQVLARISINAFRVDVVLPARGAADLQAALSDLLRSDGGAGGPDGGGDTGIAGGAGSAVYLLASMTNHSCAPNMDVTFPHNSAAAAFVANRDIRAGEQLSVSYMDAGLPVEARQQHLRFAYGFSCVCQRCIAEGAGQHSDDDDDGDEGGGGGGGGGHKH
jgi:SET and MYND domain-containing protein